jgi:hypothetical protein
MSNDNNPPQNALRENLADLAHASWSGWMKYLFEKSYYDFNKGTVTIPAGLAARWGRQMNTPYAELPEEEKESDLAEADKMIAVMKQVEGGG